MEPAAWTKDDIPTSNRVDAQCEVHETSNPADAPMPRSAADENKILPEAALVDVTTGTKEDAEKSPGIASRRQDAKNCRGQARVSGEASLPGRLPLNQVSFNYVTRIS